MPAISLLWCQLRRYMQLLNCLFVAGTTAFWLHFSKCATRHCSSSHCN